MAENAQVTKILESINQKSKKCQDELISTIIGDFEDAVVEMKDPLSRAKQSLDKAGQTLDTSRSTLEAFVGNVSETIEKFEKGFEVVGAEIEKKANDKLGELKEVLASAVRNTKDIMEISSLLDTRVTEISSILNTFREENSSDIKALMIDFQKNYEKDNDKAALLNQKIKKAICLAIAVGIANLGLITAVLVSILTKN